MKLALTVSYDGTNYCGWQVQPTGVTVQSVLQDAIFKLTGEQVTVTGSGRTDAGVHAEGQVASFSLQNCTIPCERFARALNTFLPSDVKALECREVSEDFDARKSAKKKTYRYSFYINSVEKPLLERYALRLDKEPNLALIEKALTFVVGERDFACFNASGGGAKTTVRRIYDARFVKSGQDRFDFFVTGNGFLYNMVRTLAGTLLDVGYGKISPERLGEIISLKQRNAVGRTLSAKGLCLLSVEYQE